ncbi:diguanylate cyclase [Coleofasciculus sp. FACHB-1120]|uniref:diguanylate cyclase n=1 Tax=Coleofasciculus sp. FACHB-1120 TaxID=2692783 RepID=UPI0016878BB4|nr:diguanylate cyclase [Coleofasciculus sp. FACHB-1120]MBD2741636.1 diguanylate cyclase [Coleofasciculus sp. FACHB-1120]
MKKQPSLLVASRNQHNLQLLAQFLIQEGYPILTADSLEEFEQALRHSAQISLALVDISSIDSRICEWLRQEAIPILMLSNQADSIDWQFALIAGAADYRIKPIGKAELLTRVSSILKHKSKHELGKADEKKQRKVTLLRPESPQMFDDLAFRDALTGIANRHHFEEILEREWRRAAREARFLSMIIINLDFFKVFKETYGLQRGDYCLREVAKSLSAAVKRCGDVVARYGGEEFVTLLPDTNRSGAIVVAEAMRLNVTALNISYANSPIGDRVTISLGVATLIPERNSTPQALIAEAQRMLSVAKEEGRDRFKIHPIAGNP